MIKKIIPLIIILITGCSTLPKSDDGYGFLVIKVTEDNNSDRDYLAAYQLFLNGKRYLTRVEPRNQLKFIKLKEGDYTLNNIQSLPYDPIEEKGDPYYVRTKFSIEANKVTVLEKSINIYQKKHETKEGWTTQSYKYDKITIDEMVQIIEKLSYYENADIWGINHKGNKLGEILTDKSIVSNNDNIQEWYKSYLFTENIKKLNNEEVKKALNSDIEINFVDFLGNTPLSYAITNNNVEILNLLISKGADVNLKDNKKRSPLMVATLEDNLPIVERLLNERVDINNFNNSDGSALVIAARNGYTDIVDLLIRRGVDLNITKDIGASALMESIMWGKTDISKLLIDAGADLNLVSNRGNSALFYSILNQNEEVFDFLLQYGADPNTITTDGESLLTYALSIGLKKYAVKLINSGIDINHNNNKSGTALIIAISKGYTEIVDLLLERGADLNNVRSRGINALMESIIYGKTDISKKLISAGANLDMISEGGETALSYSMSKGQKEIFNNLIENGADINIPDTDGNSLLHNALKQDQQYYVNTLLHRGIDINLINNKGNTPLSYALGNSLTEYVDLLLEYDPEINIINKAQWTPLLYALRNFDENISLKLLDMGADPNIPKIAEKENYYPVLHVAANYRRFKVLERLYNPERELDALTENNISWAYATTNSSYENRELALTLALSACEKTNYEKAHIIDTLAACYASLDQWDLAIEKQKLAMDLNDDEEQYDGYVERYNLYLNHERVIEPSP